MNLPIQIEFLETDYGHFLINPIGDNLFIFSPAMMNKMDKMVEDLELYGESYFAKPSTARNKE